MAVQTEVSIIICTYNPDYKKLISSVKAAVCQENVDFEIILTDDGSKCDNFEKIKAYFEKINFRRYLFIKNRDNVGTVKNLLGAVKKAKGEYVFFNSPGDYVYDKNAISDFYHFSKAKNADVCFGDYIPYYMEGNEIRYSDFIKPEFAEVYNNSFKNSKAAFFTIENILGASYFRSREFALESLTFIEKYSRYTEDGPTTAYALAKKKRVFYYNRKIVWYEYGSGISTVEDPRWKKLLTEDYLRSYEAILNAGLRDRYVKAGLFYLQYGGIDRFAINFTKKHPVIAVRRRIVKKGKKRLSVATKPEENGLKDLLRDSED